MTSKTDKVVKDRTDWARLRAMSEEEIERLAVEDEDNPATVHDDEWAHATVGLPASKTSIHASFDRDMVDWFKAQGRGLSGSYERRAAALHGCTKEGGLIQPAFLFRAGCVPRATAAASLPRPPCFARKGSA